MPKVRGVWQKSATEERTLTLTPHPHTCQTQTSLDTQTRPDLKAIGMAENKRERRGGKNSFSGEPSRPLVGRASQARGGMLT